MFIDSASRPHILHRVLIMMGLALAVGCAQRLPRPMVAPPKLVQGAECLELTRAWQEDLALRAALIFKVGGWNDLTGGRAVASASSAPVEINPGVQFNQEGAWARLELTEWNRFSDLLGRQGDALTPAIVSLVRFHAATERMDARIMRSALMDAATRLERASRALCGSKE